MYSASVAAFTPILFWVRWTSYIPNLHPISHYRSEEKEVRGWKEKEDKSLGFHLTLSGPSAKLAKSLWNFRVLILLSMLLTSS